jgi:hypothetical protein
MLWLANPILFVSWIATFGEKKALSIPLSLIPLLLAASFLTMKTAVHGEDGYPSPITGTSIGYWLWLASMIANCVAALAPRKSAEIQNSPPDFQPVQGPGPGAGHSILN